jgi:hypothetical protein
MGIRLTIPMALALVALSAAPNPANARRFRIGVVPVPHFSGSRGSDRPESTNGNQRLEDPHASVTVDEKGQPVSGPGIDWLPLLAILGGAGLSVTMVKLALRRN